SPDDGSRPARSTRRALCFVRARNQRVVMTRRKYEWRRFWCRREGNLQLDFQGYLADPEGDGWIRQTDDVVEFSKLSSTPCVVLLGEPGMGKSTAVSDGLERASAGTAKLESKT